MRGTSSLVTITVILLVWAARASAVALDAPTLQQVTSDRVSTTLSVRAGDSGTPAGFVVSYMRADDYRALGGWPDETQSGFAYLGSLDCTFSGVPTLSATPGVSSFCLDAGQSVNVVVGKFFDETGIIAEDSDELPDGTEYVFRVRAAAAPGLDASAWSPTVGSSTTVRTSTDCTVTQGFWKQHTEDWSRVVSITIGDVTYSNQQLQAILLTPARGNGLISLAHQLITAKLNQLLGALPPADVLTVIQQADALIGPLVVPPIGQGSLRASLVSSSIGVLDAFNTGRTGPAHCPNNMDIVPAKPQTWGGLKAIYR